MKLQLAGLCALALLLAQPPSAQAQQTGSITGQVVEEGTERPLGNMQVQLVGTTRHHAAALLARRCVVFTCAPPSWAP